MVDMGNISPIHHPVTKATANRRTLEHQLYQIHLWHSYRSVTYFGWGHFFPVRKWNYQCKQFAKLSNCSSQKMKFLKCPQGPKFCSFSVQQGFVGVFFFTSTLSFWSTLKKLLQKCPDTTQMKQSLACSGEILFSTQYYGLIGRRNPKPEVLAQLRAGMWMDPCCGFCCECLGTGDSQHKERKAIGGQLQLNKKNRNIRVFSKEALTAPRCWHWLEQWGWWQLIVNV